jgi:hypothetical protein
MSILIGCAILVVLLAIAWVASRRFERAQQQSGRWDEYGPLVESRGPTGVNGNEMNERLEVIGKQPADIVRRRQPHEPPKPR